MPASLTPKKTEKTKLPQVPPPAGSDLEAAETSLVTGWPGAFTITCHTVEQVIMHRLLWKSE